jgi:hypothetical protein
MNPTRPTDHHLLKKVKAYGFGDRLVDPAFRRAVNNVTIKDKFVELFHPCHMVDLVTCAFENLPSNCSLLQLLVNDFCNRWHDTYYTKYDAQALKQLPIEFSARVMRRFVELERPDCSKHGDACYLEHASDADTKACKKLHVHYNPEHDYGYLRHEKS